jgi:hypothetical protein
MEGRIRVFASPSATHEKDHIQVAGYAAVLGKPKYALINWNLGQLGKGEKLDIIIDEQPTPKDAADKVLAIWDTVESHASLGELPPLRVYGGRGRQAERSSVHRMRGARSRRLARGVKSVTHFLEAFGEHEEEEGERGAPIPARVSCSGRRA